MVSTGKVPTRALQRKHPVPGERAVATSGRGVAAGCPLAGGTGLWTMCPSPPRPRPAVSGHLLLVLPGASQGPSPRRAILQHDDHQHHHHQKHGNGHHHRPPRQRENMARKRRRPSRRRTRLLRLSAMTQKEKDRQRPRSPLPPPVAGARSGELLLTGIRRAAEAAMDLSAARERRALLAARERGPSARARMRRRVEAALRAGARLPRPFGLGRRRRQRQRPRPRRRRVLLSPRCLLHRRSS